MIRSRRELAFQLLTHPAARRRAASLRGPNWFELIVGLSAFITVVAACLYAVAWLGR